MKTLKLKKLSKNTLAWLVNCIRKIQNQPKLSIKRKRSRLLHPNKNLISLHHTQFQLQILVFWQQSLNKWSIIKYKTSSWTLIAVGVLFLKIKVVKWKSPMLDLLQARKLFSSNRMFNYQTPAQKRELALIYNRVRAQLHWIT